MTRAASESSIADKRASERKKRIPNVNAPRRRLSSSAEKSLTTRQLEILDRLDQSMLVGGFADLTMAEIAKQMTCSLRTLYGIAPSKEELVLAVADRHLQRVGREARQALELEADPLTRLRAYLRATNLALQPRTVLFSRDFNKLPGAGELASAHADYIASITQALLDEAVEAGDIEKTDTAALAFILGRLGREFARPELDSLVEGSARETADLVAEIILDGLIARRPVRN